MQEKNHNYNGSEVCMQKTMIWVTISAIALCFVFFIVAFCITNPCHNYAIPAVNITISSTNDVRSIVNDVFYSAEYQEKLKTVLQDRECIVVAEHERFRAELATWLSIFGLLSILATIMVAAFSYACQQASLKDEKQKLQDKFKEQEEELKKLGSRLDEELKGSAVSTINGAVEDAQTQHSDSQDGPKDDLPKQDEVNSCVKQIWDVHKECIKFVKMWPLISDDQDRKNFVFMGKAESGINVLQRYNKLLQEYNTQTEAILKKMNFINIYLGQIKNTDFNRVFLSELRKSKPLTISLDEIKGRLTSADKEIILGYYRQLFNLQNQPNVQEPEL